MPLIISDHETTPRSCISHDLNVSVTYKEEADILSALSYLHGDGGKIPDDECTFFFLGTRKWELSFLPSDLSLILFHELEKKKKRKKLVFLCKALFIHGLLCDRGK